MLGKVDEFDSTKEEWPQYVERLGHFFDANSIESAEKKRSVLLNGIGSATYTVLRNLTSPKKPGEESYTDLVKKLADHFSPVPSEIVQRFKFNTRTRKPGESVANFVAELRALAEFCNFGETLEVMLRDRLVCGIADSTIQKALLAKSELDFKQALDIARGLERAARNMKELKSPAPRSDSINEASTSESVCKVTSGNKQSRKVTSKTTADVVCYRCGRSGHLISRCRVNKSVTCHQCGRTGHLQTACQSGKRGKRSVSQSAGSRPVCHVEEEDIPILHIRATRKTSPYKVTLQVDSCDVVMEVDTGSSVSIISKTTYESLQLERELSPCKYRLHSYL